jgi:capsule polysaccharide export protein KpsE/RkpR
MPQSAVEALARLKAQIVSQEIKLASLRTFMTDANPQFRLAERELIALRAELSKAEQRSNSRGGGDGAEYITRYREFKYYETLFDLMASSTNWLALTKHARCSDTGNRCGSAA